MDENEIPATEIEFGGGLSVIDLEVDDNRIILTAANHRMAMIFVKGLVQLFAGMGPEHVIVKDDDEPVQ